jgi:hypothetical protein
MKISELAEAVKSPGGLSQEQREKYLRPAFTASFRALEARGILRPLDPLEVYTTGPDIRIEALFEYAVPVRDGVMAGPPLTRRDIERLRRTRR